MWEKLGTSGRGMGVGSRVGADVVPTGDGTATVHVGSGINVTGKAWGGDSVSAGWQAGTSKETRAVIHKRRMINFMSASFAQIIRVKSKCIGNVTNKTLPSNRVFATIPDSSK